MADYRAIMGITEGVIQLLRTSYSSEDFNNDLEFKVFTSKDFANPIANGVSLFVYRIFPHRINRTPAPSLGVNGRRLRSILPVEVHFLLTVWGKDASLQHSVAGWLMTLLEDSPTLPAGLMNTVADGIFRPEESVDICLAELETEDLFRIWDVLGRDIYELSIPYVARVINLESSQELPAGSTRRVQDRTLETGYLQPSPRTGVRGT